MEQVETLKTVIRWLCIILVVVCVLWCATNAYWLWSWMQYDYVTEETTVTVDAEDGIASYIGRDGFVNGESDRQDNQNEPDETRHEGNENPEILKEETP